MKTYRMRKFAPQEERGEDIRHTLIASIMQKRQRMNTEQLKELYRAAIQTVQKQ